MLTSPVDRPLACFMGLEGKQMVYSNTSIGIFYHIQKLIKCTRNNIYCLSTINVWQQKGYMSATNLNSYRFYASGQCFPAPHFPCPPPAHTLCTFGLLLTRILRTFFHSKYVSITPHQCYSHKSQRLRGCIVCEQILLPLLATVGTTDLFYCYRPG